MAKVSFKKALLGTALSLALAVAPLSLASAAEVKATWDSDKVTITNNTTGADIVKVEGLKEGQTVKVYNSKAADRKPIGQATVKKGTTVAEVKVSKGIPDTGGTIYITVTLESEDYAGTVESAPQTASVVTDKVYIVNNHGLKDTVTIKGLSDKTVVTVTEETYPVTSTVYKVLGKGTKTTKNDDVVINVSQLKAEGAAGKVRIILQEPNKIASEAVLVPFDAEKTTSVTNVAYEVYNNYLLKDTIKLYEKTAGDDISVGDIITVYSTADHSKKLGSVKVTTADSFTISIAKLTTTGAGGTVYATLKKVGQKESDNIEVTFGDEPVTTAPSVSDLAYKNNVGSTDTITVSNVKTGDVITLYNGTTKLLTKTVTTGTSITITTKLNPLGATTYGVTKKSTGEKESAKTILEYGPDGSES